MPADAGRPVLPEELAGSLDRANSVLARPVAGAAQENHAAEHKGRDATRLGGLRDHQWPRLVCWLWGPTDLGYHWLYGFPARPLPCLLGSFLSSGRYETVICAELRR